MKNHFPLYLCLLYVVKEIAIPHFLDLLFIQIWRSLSFKIWFWTIQYYFTSNYLWTHSKIELQTPQKKASFQDLGPNTTESWTTQT